MATGSIIAGRYRLVRCIGAGGMGEVWEAVHELTSKRVAIKVLNATYAGQAEVRARFLQEARAACCVRHPNVVQIHDVIETSNGAPAMVMDLLNGESLGSLRERVSAIPLSELAAILAPAIDAVAAAHAMGIVHRDLKPDNLFLEKGLDGRVAVRVLDFGIAKVIHDPNQSSPSDCALTKTGALLGTPYYMSPEQAYGEKDLDHRSDIYSLGLIIHECLTGKRPTEADNFGQIMKLITMGGIPPLASLIDVPAEVSELVVRMLSVARVERPALAEVHAVLARYARCAPAISFAPPRAVDSTAATVAAIDGSSSHPKLESTGSGFEVSMPAGVPRPFGRVMALAAVAAIAVATFGAGLFQLSSAKASRSAAATGVGVVASPPPVQADPPPVPVAITPPAPEPSALVTPAPVSTPTPPTARATAVTPAKGAPARSAKAEAAAPATLAAAPAAPQKTDTIGKIHDGPAPF